MAVTVELGKAVTAGATNAPPATIDDFIGLLVQRMSATGALPSAAPAFSPEVQQYFEEELRDRVAAKKKAVDEAKQLARIGAENFESMLATRTMEQSMCRHKMDNGKPSISGQTVGIGANAAMHLVCLKCQRAWHNYRDVITGEVMPNDLVPSEARQGISGGL